MYRLEWDSQFWDLEIYNVDENYNFNIPNSNKNCTSGSKEWLIQALVPEDKVEIINFLEDNGFRFVETKINLKKKVVKKIEIDENKFKDVDRYDIQPYKNEFNNLYGKYSRFSVFNKEKVNDFYYTWVLNSINGEMDDKCIGYYIEDKLAGFITYKFKNNELSIGLLGVFQAFQRKGISQHLLNYINNKALEEGYNAINVSTQGKNYNAINTYIKNGYFIKSIQNWYYLRGDNYDTI